MNNALELSTILHRVASGAHYEANYAVIATMAPTFKRLEIAQRVAQCDDAMAYILSGGDHYLKGLTDTQPTLLKASKGGMCDIVELVALNKVNHRIMTLKKQDMRHLRGAQVLDVLDGLFIPASLIQRLDACFSPFGEVLDSASTTLAKLRKQYKEVEAAILKQTQEFMRSHASKLSEQIVTLRQDRYVLMAKVGEKNTFHGLVVGESASGQTAYVEPPFLMQLNNQKQSVQSLIENEIERIVRACSDLVGQHYIPVSASHESLMMLDIWFAKARYGLEHDGFMPTLGGNVLHLEAARHPLIDPKKVVPNTYTLDASTRMCIISGPNTGGKTVSLKIIGLFTLMAYCGIPLLAKKANIPFYDAVFADIGDESSIQSSLSTFSAHIFHIASILNEATAQSLVLLDELGSGTDPDEGESLAIAILHAFHQQGCTLVATTHYNRIKSIAYEWEGVMISSVEFDITTLSPTYRFLPHQAGQSNALAIASRFNLPSSLLERAHRELASKQSEAATLLERLHEQIALNQTLEATLLAQQKALSIQMETLKRETDQLLEQQNRLQSQAQAHIDELVQAALEEINMYLNEAKSQQQSTPVLTKIKQEVQARKTKPQLKVDETIAVNDYVRVKGSQRSGQVIEIKGNNTLIDINGMRIKTSLAQLEKSAPPVIKKRVASYSSSTSGPRGSVLECVVVGLRGDEAIAKVDDYIEDCLLANIPNGIIIHGIGTLTLKKVIGEHLARHPNVKSYGQAPLEQGGIVATVVTFK